MEIKKYTEDDLEYLYKVKRGGITYNREQIASEYMCDSFFDEIQCPCLFSYETMEHLKPFIYEIEREFGLRDSPFYGPDFGSGFEEDYGPIDILYQFDYGTCKAKFVAENGMFIINISKHDSVDDVIYRIIHHFEDLFPDYAE